MLFIRSRCCISVSGYVSERLSWQEIVVWRGCDILDEIGAYETGEAIGIHRDGIRESHQGVYSKQRTLVRCRRVPKHISAGTGLVSLNRWKWCPRGEIWGERQRERERERRSPFACSTYLLAPLVPHKASRGWSKLPPRKRLNFCLQTSGSSLDIETPQMATLTSSEKVLTDL